jgi:pilus assembly protein Flp/PilA
MQKYLERSLEFLKDEEGASAAEYALLASLIAAVAAAGIAALGNGVLDLYNDAVNKLPFGS